MPIQIDSLASKSSEKSRESRIVGIDLGTTNSLVAIVCDGKPQVLNSREGSHLVPSVVSLIDGKVVVGIAAKKKKVRDAKHTVFSAKRLLGRSFEDLKKVQDQLPYELVPGGEGSGEGIVKIKIGDQSYTAIEISAMILKELKLAAEKELGTPVHRAVITVPAYFNDAQRQATRTAGRLAGLDVLRIINEPTAASLAYGLDRKRQGQIVVYDLGGGTFDVSILKLHDGIFEVLSTHGDTALGGDDFDQAIAKAVSKDIENRFGISLSSDVQLLASVLEAAEKVKIELSLKSESVFEVQIQGEFFRRVISLKEFERWVYPILERTREPCLKALSDAGLKLSEISDVVLVGGPTRLKVVQDFVQKLFERVPNTSVHPDEVVAEGAAIQADILSGNNTEVLLLDVVPLSLGLETYGGLMSPLILRNTKIPTVAREVFTTFADRQTGVDIHVLQGERERVEDNRSLAQFKLKGIQPMPAGMPRIEVTFLIDADGILQVAAKDLKTGAEQSVEVRPSFGLTDAEVEKMLLSGHEHAAEDIAYRRLIEARNKAEPVLRAVEKQLPEAVKLLTKEDFLKVKGAFEELKTAIQHDDPMRIQNATSQLNDATVRLAELIIKQSLV